MEKKFKYYKDIVSFQLYPNEEQKKFLDKELNFCYRFKKFLKEKEDWYVGKNGKFKSFKHARAFFNIYKEKIIQKYIGKFDSNFFLSHFDFCVDSKASSYSSENVFNEKRGEFRYNRQTMRIDSKEQIGIYEDMLWFGDQRIKIRPHARTISPRPRFFTIYKENEKYFLDCLVYKNVKKTKYTGVFCGIDFGIKNTFTIVDTLNNITVFKLEKPGIEKAYDKIKFINKHIRNLKEKNPYNYWKSKNYLRLINEKTKQARQIKRIRSRVYNEFCDELCSKYDYISIEGLNTEEMYKNENMRSRLRLYGFPDFRAILLNQADKHGKTVYRCSRYFKSSQICHHCGQIINTMNERFGKKEKIECQCGYIEDRDVNAARNLIDEMCTKLNIKPENNFVVFKKVVDAIASKSNKQMSLFDTQ